MDSSTSNLSLLQATPLNEADNSEITESSSHDIPKPTMDHPEMTIPQDEEHEHSKHVRLKFPEQRAKSGANRSNQIDYRKLAKDRELLTVKLREVENEIEKEERLRSINRRGRATSAMAAFRSPGQVTVTKELIEFSARAGSARFRGLADKTRHRFKTAEEEQALIVSDTLHQMDNRRVELVDLKFKSLAFSATGSASNDMKPTNVKAAESFERATRRLRAKTAAAEKQRMQKLEKESEEKQRDWFGSLKTGLPPQLMDDWRCRRIMERLEKHSNIRPNGTTDLVFCEILLQRVTVLLLSFLIVFRINFSIRSKR